MGLAEAPTTPVKPFKKQQNLKICYPINKLK